MSKTTFFAYSLGGLLLVGAVALAWPSPQPTPAALAASRKMLVLGHAGSGFFTPLNPFNPLPPSSRAGFRRALERGADGLEVDVRLSRDSVAVLYHDTRLNSMTNGEGCVSQYPATELEKLAYRGGPPYDWFHDEYLITLQTLLADVPQGAAFPYLHVDLHEEDACAPEAPSRSAELARALVRELRRPGIPAERLLILTTNVETLRALRQRWPEVPLGLEIGDDNFDAELATARAEGVQAVVVSKDAITPERSTRAHAAGLQVVVFGGRSAKSLSRVVNCQPDAVEIDNLEGLLKMLGRK